MTNDSITTMTIEEIRKLALPIDTRIVTGNGLLDVPVHWVTVVRPEDLELTRQLQPRELIIVAAAQSPSQNGTDANRDLDIIHWAYEQKASAVLTLFNPSTAAVAEARAYQIPLLSVHSDHHPRDVERAIITQLVEREGQIERRATQIFRQLTQISARNVGMSEMIDTIGRLTRKTVVLQDKRLAIFERTLQPALFDDWDQIDQFIRQSDHLPRNMQDRRRVADLNDPVQRQELPVAGLTRYVTPVVTDGVGRGYLSIIAPDNEFSPFDRVVAEHGAAAVALEMAKAKAIRQTEKRLRGNFLDRVLLGDVTNTEAVRQGERFEHNMQQMHIAIVLAWSADEKPSMRRLETIVNSIVDAQRASALVWQREREEEVVVFHATREDNPIDHTIKLAEAFAREIKRQFGENQIAIGLGQPAREVSSWRNSHRDAVQARELAERLQTDAPLYIGDLGVYQLILSLNDREKLIAFCDRTLGTLIDYDVRQKADLIKTLEAFFACHGNLSQTAEMLIVHRNTLLYRMNRINEIASIDLNRPETRLSIHLALTIRRLLAAS